MLDFIRDFSYTKNGEKRCCLDGKFFRADVPFELQLEGHRISEAEAYLMTLEFTLEEAQEYIDALPHRK